VSKFKNIFFTSDWHIGHENSLKFDKRPFKDLADMHRVLINNYNSSVKEDDVCYFLGDVGLTKGDEIKEVISKLNGTKVLVLGNHDGGSNAMYQCGFDVVINSASLVIAKELVTLSHCPLPGIRRENVTDMKGSKPGENWHGELRESAKYFTVPNNGQFHLHGHIHSPNGGKSEKILDKQYDIGVVSNKYRPVSSSQIESWIALYKRGNNVS
jgi:calcineurin-like phosphoesterase family protein